MRRSLIALLVGLSVCCFAAAAQAKSKPAHDKDKEQKEGQEQQPIPTYKPFPHNFNFVLKDINGKTPPVEMWMRIDSTLRGTGFSGCKAWSGVFVVGANRLGPKAMPAVSDKQCDPALQTLEREFWNVLLSGPYWDTEGSDLILKGFKGGVLRFTRSL